jgi:hypothetical protein
MRITKEHTGATPPHGFGWHLSWDHVVHHAICRYSAVYCSVLLMYPHTFPYQAGTLGQSRSRSFVPQKSTMPLGSALIIADPCTTNHSYSIWSITSSSSLLHFLPCSEIVQDNKHLPCFIFLLGGRLPRLFILAKLKKKNIYKNYQAPRSSSNSFLPQLSILFVTRIRHVTFIMETAMGKRFRRKNQCNLQIHVLWPSHIGASSLPSRGSDVCLNPHILPIICLTNKWDSKTSWPILSVN